MSDYNADIDKLIREWKYDEAREVAYEHFADNTLYGCQTRQLNKIAMAQYQEYFEEKDFRAVKELRKELKKKGTYAFQKVFAENMEDLLKQGKTDFVIATLQEWEIFHHLRMEVDQWPKNIDYYMEEGTVYDDDFDEAVADGWRLKTDQPGEYNSEVRFYNGLLDKVIATLTVQSDQRNIEECQKLYRPYAIIKEQKNIPGKYDKDLGGYMQRYIFDVTSR